MENMEAIFFFAALGRIIGGLIAAVIGYFLFKKFLWPFLVWFFGPLIGNGRPKK